MLHKSMARFSFILVIFDEFLISVIKNVSCNSFSVAYSTGLPPLETLDIFRGAKVSVFKCVFISFITALCSIPTRSDRSSVVVRCPL